ncbi:hypothetical protein CDLVIII_4747 [Clostridium sp. DL-VIII]|uniref:hypothetical protein n=1 Tax=Clostridium sp. DL-VIII TaxID=641107 RepID=UPI00023B02CE|nr:hypothetical protein [Clostridium sp. DL-VIII]EHJ01242.1 hypothetical protein CDLVIII_4747 [Clostridium sp. DL-VIII]
MLKTILKPIEVILKSRIEQSGLKDEFAKYPEYVAKAKEIWDMIDKDFGISNTIENMLKIKIDKFDETLNKKFPELKSEDITKLKESIIGEFNENKGKVLNQVYAFKELQDLYTKVQEENEKLKEQLGKIQEVLPSNVNTESIKDKK